MFIYTFKKINLLIYIKMIRFEIIKEIYNTRYLMMKK